jgi:hypothetical protein
MDAENLIWTRGDLTTLNHDLLKKDMFSSRIKQNGFTVPPPPDPIYFSGILLYDSIDVLQNYYYFLQLRLTDGQVAIYRYQSLATETISLFGGIVHISGPTTVPDLDSIVSIGESADSSPGEQSINVIVESIDYDPDPEGDELSATISLVDYASSML